MSEADARLGLMDAAPERAGLGRLARRYRLPLVRYFTRRGVAAESAEDCAQDVFLRMAQAQTGRVENAEAYLFRVASNVLVDRLRRERVRPAAADCVEAEVLPAPDPGAARIFEDRQALQRLAAALDELPPNTREIFLLNRLDGLSYAELAARRRMSVKAVEREIGKALAHVRKRIPLHERG